MKHSADAASVDRARDRETSETQIIPWAVIEVMDNNVEVLKYVKKKSI